MSIVFDFLLSVIEYLLTVDVIIYLIVAACLYCLVLLILRMTGGLKQ